MANTAIQLLKSLTIYIIGNNLLNNGYLMGRAKKRLSMVLTDFVSLTGGAFHYLRLSMKTAHYSALIDVKRNNMYTYLKKYTF